jgi:hypothetical protein
MKITSSHIINKISLPSSSYLSDSHFFSSSGPIFIEIKREALDQKNNLLTIINNNLAGFKFHPSSMFGPYVIISSDIDKFREIIDFLFSNQLINNVDRSNIEIEILLVEKHFGLQQKITPQITAAQLDILKSMCEEQIDCLLDLLSTEEMDDCIGLLEAFPGVYKEYYNLEDWLSKNWGHVSGIKQQELVESFEYLAKIFNGIANLEETYLLESPKFSSVDELYLTRKVF